MICPTCGHERETVDPARCAHDFEEIELGGMGKIKRCRICGTAGEVGREKKRKKYRCYIPDPYGGKEWKNTGFIELEEVENC